MPAPERMETRFQVVTDAADPAAGKETLARLTESGKPGAATA